MAQLRAYKWQLEGGHQVASGLTLNNAQFTIERIDYHVPSRSARIEVLFTEGEGLFTHSRNYFFSIPDNAPSESISSAQVLTIISTIFPSAVIIEGGGS